MIIWLASYPRSGNTFFRILMNKIYGIETYSIYNDPLFDDQKASSDVIGHLKLPMPLENMAASEKFFFVKTHKLPSDNYPAIYLIRDGRDALVSYAHYIQSFNKELFFQKHWQSKIKVIFGGAEYTEILRQLIVSQGRHTGSWSENVTNWVNRNETTVVLKFEDLVKNPSESLTTAINSLGFSEMFTEIENNLPNFEELHSQWPNFFRQGKRGGWQKEMNTQLQDLFWKNHGQVMTELGYR